MRYELALECYKGPLDKLLGLIEEKKMEITEVSLAEVTNDFLSYLRELETFEKSPQELIADFLVVASKLVLIKSKTLLPSLELNEDEEESIKELEFRLKLYQELKGAQAHIKERWSGKELMRGREFLMSSGPVFYPPKKISKKHFLDAIKKITGDLEKILKPIAIVKTEIIDLKEKIKEILDRVMETSLSFSNFREGKSKGEVVVLFLAVLHLIKEQLVSVNQKNHFEDIVVAKKAGNE